MKLMMSPERGHKETFDALYRQSPEYRYIHEKGHLETVLDAYSGSTIRDRLVTFFYPRFCRHIYTHLDLVDGQRVLNIGCGFGFDELNLKRSYPGLRLVGIDISETMVTAAKKNGTPAFLCMAMAEALPFRNHLFDRLFSREVIEHVLHPEAMVREIRRVLKPGGICVIATPHPTSLDPYQVSQRLAMIAGRSPRRSWKDEPLPIGQMKEIFERNGFQLKEIVFDGALYFDLSTLPEGKAHWVHPLAQSFQLIERLPLLNRLFCNQVKYVVVSREESVAETGPYPRKEAALVQAGTNRGEPWSSRPASSSVMALAWVMARAISLMRKNAVANWILVTGYVLLMTALLFPFSLTVSLIRKARHGR